jgi:hypothetical protein
VGRLAFVVCLNQASSVLVGVEGSRCPRCPVAVGHSAASGAGEQ